MGLLHFPQKLGESLEDDPLAAVVVGGEAAVKRGGPLGVPVIAIEGADGFHERVHGMDDDERDVGAGAKAPAVFAENAGAHIIPIVGIAGGEVTALARPAGILCFLVEKGHRHAAEITTAWVAEAPGNRSGAKKSCLVEKFQLTGLRGVRSVSGMRTLHVICKHCATTRAFRAMTVDGVETAREASGWVREQDGAVCPAHGPRPVYLNRGGAEAQRLEGVAA